MREKIINTIQLFGLPALVFVLIILVFAGSEKCFDDYQKPQSDTVRVVVYRSFVNGKEFGRETNTIITKKNIKENIQP